MYIYLPSILYNKLSESLRFCQFQKNNSYHSSIKKSLFEVFFGKKAQLDLSYLRIYSKH
ncbi:KRAB-A domain-containing protein 2-like [Aphis craccivora]|uniref:KRAB-A domain-containing protein 2-like n=1 Tax=Aphis craccivora TaxID=307492 RepID=A0A6G0YWE9_APHCR|nr:KRAB-A domain-containing protein 2-like [Aphis craccivora]